MNRVVAIAAIGATVLIAALVLNYFVFLDSDAPGQKAEKTPAATAAPRLRTGRSVVRGKQR